MKDFCFGIYSMPIFERMPIWKSNKPHLWMYDHRTGYYRSVHWTSEIQNYLRASEQQPIKFTICA
ncbi:hypothetical protein T03_6002, partial [Trichinella britovi]